MNQLDGFVTPSGFIIRLYQNPPCVWVYWPRGGMVRYYLSTIEQTQALYEALKPIQKEPDEAKDAEPR